MKTLLWILLAQAFLVPFALPGFIPSQDAYDKAIEQGFTPEQIERGRQYAFERRLLSWPSTCLHLALLTILAVHGRELADRCSRWTGGRWLATVVLAGVVLGVVEEAVTLPFGLARLEHTRLWGLTQQSQADWLGQHFLALAVYWPIELVVLAIFCLFVRYTPRTWWLWSALGTTLFAVAGAYLLPILFAPLFNTFVPLSQTKWKDQEPLVQKLLAKAHVSVGDVLVMDASRQSGHSNAYFTGFGPTRRIVLYDTLLEKHEPAEIESILAHELGHWLHNHIVQGICLGGLGALVGFILLFLFLRWIQGKSPWFLRDAADAAGLPLIVLCGVLASWLAMPLENAVSRHFERQADAMSLDLARDPAVFIAAEKKLALDNITNVAPNPVAVFLFSTHPPPVDRIRKAQEWKQE